MRGLPLEGPSFPNWRSFSADGPEMERQLWDAPPPPTNRRSSSADAAVNERQLEVAAVRDRLQREMTTYAGVLRDGPGLDRAAKAVAAVAADLAADLVDDAGGRDTAELRALLAVAAAVVSAATEREESRGCHHRLDFPESHQPLERIVHFGPDRRLRVPASAAVPERER
jgi:succinate dehydrogenase/fumarate reductase flavoprotein subunit